MLTDTFIVLPPALAGGPHVTGGSKPAEGCGAPYTTG